MSESVNLSLNMSPELAEKLEHMSEETHSSKSDIICKALLIMDIAIDNKKYGNRLALINKDGKTVSEIKGV